MIKTNLGKKDFVIVDFLYIRTDPNYSRVMLSILSFVSCLPTGILAEYYRMFAFLLQPACDLAAKASYVTIVKENTAQPGDPIRS